MSFRTEASKADILEANFVSLGETIQYAVLGVMRDKQPLALRILPKKTKKKQDS